MSKDKLIPELRFPEFEKEGEWELTSIGSIGNFYYGKSAPKWSLSEDAPTLCVRYGELYTKFDAIISDVKSRTNIEPSNLKFSKGGEILVPRVGERPSDFAKNCCYLPFSDIAIGEMISVFETKEFPIFYTYYFRTLWREFAEVVEGQNVKNLYYVNLEPIKIGKTSYAEQEKIASCLSSLDELIYAHNEKLDALKDHKKGLIQNLFPNSLNHDSKGLRDDHDFDAGIKSRNQANQKNQGSDNVPKVRFPEFEGDGEWVEKKLGTCLLQKPEYGINAPAVPYSDYLPKYLRITDISEDGNLLSNSKVSVDRDVNENNYLNDGDIALARTGASVGKSYKYREKDGRLVFAGFLIRVKPDKKKLDSEFLFQFLSTSQYWEWVRFISARSGQPGINGTEYASMPISLPPTLKEQQKIASCLSAVDELITAQADKIEQLHQHKKGLMQGLFPKSITN